MYATQPLHQILQQNPTQPLSVNGDRVRTAEQVADRVARLAGGLRELGVETGDRVGMLGLNSDYYAEYLLAVPWADAVINPVNHRWSPTEIADALSESGTQVLMVDQHFLRTADELRARYPEVRTLIFYGDGDCPDDMIDGRQVASHSGTIEDAERGGDDLYGVFYTGGTTGTPKGVMLSHNAVMMNAIGTLSTGDFLTHGGRLLHVAPMFHLADIFVWLMGLFTHSTHVFASAFTPDGVLELLEKEQITDALLVPTMLQVMLYHPDVASRDLSAVQHVVYGTSPMSESLLARADEVFPNAGYAQAYGMTELAPVATVLRPADHDDPSLRRSGGRAAPHAEVRIVDADDQELPRGTVGEIIARGDHMMSGYWARPEETAAAVRNGWMHTGDAGYMDQRGYVFVVDRLKDMVISGGENVYSAEVENALMKHPGIAGCAVVGVPDERWGERVHAVIVLQDGAEPDLDEVRAFCRDHIAAYKAPRSMETVDALPVSGSGKVLKRVLREKHWADAGRSI